MPSRSRAAVLAAVFLAARSAAADGPPPLDPERVAAGRRIYREHCASCHGAEGQGAPGWQEPNEAGELPPPPHGPEGHTWRHDDASLRHMIREGWRDPFNQTQRLTMPAFGDILSPEQTTAVIDYLKSLWTDDQRRFQWQETVKQQPLAESTAGGQGGHR